MIALLANHGRARRQQHPHPGSGGRFCRFYLIPGLRPHGGDGRGETLVEGCDEQSFFTLSLGIGAMGFFGSYIGKGRALMGEASQTSLCSTPLSLHRG